MRRPPRSYRPGSLLQRLKADLQGWDFDLIAADRARVRAPGIELEAREVVEPQFLMHVVSTEFYRELPAAETRDTAVICARHRGIWRRTGVEFVSAAGQHDDLAERLTGSASLQTALMELDFTAWRLHRCERSWSLTVRHFGASEVVGHMPAFRRYVRLEKAQRDALVASMSAVEDLLRQNET